MREVSTRLRESLPVAIGRAAELVVDNPGQAALIFAAGITFAAAARNIVRPRTALEALSLALVVEVVTFYGTARAVEAGWIPIKVRDHACPEADQG